MRIKDLTGQKFGNLTAIKFSHKDDRNNAHWHFTCDCGTDHVARGSEVSRGAIQSCGCIRVENTKKANVKHGMARTPTYKTWISMRSRCTNESDVNYSQYGGRGISVCDEWLSEFTVFLADMGEQPEGLSLDRIDNDKGYSKENCRWATAKEQHRNKRNSKYWFIDGVRYDSHLQAAKKLGKAGRTIITWCEGGFAKGKWYPPKENCHSELKYGGAP